MNNKITLSLLGGALVSGSAFAGEVVAPLVEVSPSYEADVTVGAHSDYIFRGARLGTDLVDSAVNVSKSAWGLDFTAGAWYGSFVNDGDNIDELDLTFGVSKDFGFARFNTGYIHYNADSGTANEELAEVYVGFSKDLCYGLSSSLTYFIDASGELSSDEGDNNGYSELSLAKSDLFLEGLTLSNDLGYLVEKGQLSHNTTTLGYDYSLSENATITPYIAYTWELDALEEHASFTEREQNRFYGGVALTVSF
ncbi:MAG: hypothetical protein ABGY95_01900 [Rubritalea sp.]|uniref:hypothetical protein n=1 Tax=Rubritalea sp. TaxID=2109375 RepID=UPI003242B269